MSNDEYQDQVGMFPTERPPPFKPFTLAEVAAMSNAARQPVDVPAANRLLERWAHVLPVRTGDDGRSHGMDWMQAFGVHCGRRWFEEGAGIDRADRVCKQVAGMTIESLMDDLEHGRTFPAALPSTSGGHIYVMVKAPRQRAGQELNLQKLLGEFRAGVDSVFSKKEQG